MAEESLKSTGKIIVDDWGLSPGINQAVIELAEQNKIYGVSIMPGTQHLNCYLSELLKFKNIKIGCHLNFTYPSPSLSQRILLFETPSQLRQRVQGQINLVFSLTGRVDYLDGHHHVHLWPRVFGAAKFMAKKHSLKIRMIDDLDHLGSWLLFRMRDSSLKNSEKLYANYLTCENFKNENSLISKLNSHRPAVAHPSAVDDFAGFGIKDSLSEERTLQYKRLRELPNSF